MLLKNVMFFPADENGICLYLSVIRNLHSIYEEMSVCSLDGCLPHSLFQV